MMKICSICYVYNDEAAKICMNCSSKFPKEILFQKESAVNTDDSKRIDRELREKYLGAGRTDIFYEQFIPKEKTKKQREIKPIATSVSELEEPEVSETDRAARIRFNKLIEVLIHEAKYYSFVIKDRTIMEREKIEDEYSIRWMNMFLRDRPEELRELGTMEIPKALGDLIFVFEEVVAGIDKRNSIAINFVNERLRQLKQLNEFLLN